MNGHGRGERAGSAPAAFAGRPELALDELLDALDIDAVEALAADGGLGVPIRTVVVADLESLQSLTPGTLALVPGIAGDERTVLAVLGRAAAAGAAAIVMRTSAWSATGGTRLASEVPLPVIGAPDALGWGELYEMLTAVLSLSTGALERQVPGRPLADLFSFADAVAVALGGAVSIENPQGQVLAYSNVEGQHIDEEREQAILARRVALTEPNRAEYIELSRTLGPLRFEAHGEVLARLAIAVRAGEEILGFLWLIDHDRDPVPDVRGRLVEAGRMAALALVRARAIDDAGRRRRDDGLRRLLDGARDHGLLAAAGLRRGAAVGVLAARRVGPAPSGDPAAGWLSDFIALCARVHFEDARCVDIDGVVYMVATTSPSRWSELQTLAATIVERLAGRQPLQIGVGTGARAEQLAAARRTADRVLVALAARGAEPGWATIDEVRSLAVLTELVEVAAERPSLLGGAVAEILSPAADLPEWTVPTLRAYFDSLGNANAAAARLNVHPNTLRYRLARIVARFELDLDDPDDRLVLGLQLRLAELDAHVP